MCQSAASSEAPILQQGVSCRLGDLTLTSVAEEHMLLIQQQCKAQRWVQTVSLPAKLPLTTPMTKGSVKTFFSWAPGTALSPLRTALLVAKSSWTIACHTRARAAVLLAALGSRAMRGRISFTMDSCDGTCTHQSTLFVCCDRMPHMCQGCSPADCIWQQGNDGKGLFDNCRL